MKGFAEQKPFQFILKILIYLVFPVWIGQENPALPILSLTKKCYLID